MNHQSSKITSTFFFSLLLLSSATSAVVVVSDSNNNNNKAALLASSTRKLSSTAAISSFAFSPEGVAIGTFGEHLFSWNPQQQMEDYITNHYEFGNARNEGDVWSIDLMTQTQTQTQTTTDDSSSSEQQQQQQQQVLAVGRRSSSNIADVSIYQWNITNSSSSSSSPTLLKWLTGHSYAAYDAINTDSLSFYQLKFSPDQKWLVCGMSDRLRTIVLFWNTTDWSLRQTLKVPYPISHMVFNDDASQFAVATAKVSAAASADEEVVEVWQQNTNNNEQTNHEEKEELWSPFATLLNDSHYHRINSIVYLSNDEILIAGSGSTSRPPSLQSWNTQTTNAPLQTVLSDKSCDQVDSIALHPSSRNSNSNTIVALGCTEQDSPTIQLWDFTQNKLLHTLTEDAFQFSTMEQVTFSPSTADDESSSSLWAVIDGNELYVWNTTSYLTEAASVLPSLSSTTTTATTTTTTTTTSLRQQQRRRLRRKTNRG